MLSKEQTHPSQELLEERKQDLVQGKKVPGQKLGREKSPLEVTGRQPVGIRG